MSPIPALALAAVWGGSAATEKFYMPDHARWVNPPGLDAAVRSALAAKAPRVADWTSTGLVVGGIAAAFGVEAWGQRKGGLKAMYLYCLPLAQAISELGTGNQGTKFGVARQRPYSHQASPDGKSSDPDSLASFFSMHTATITCAVVGAYHVAEMHGNKAEARTFALMLPLPAIVGALRIAADKHYLTDVLTGMAAGAVAGWYGVR